MNRDEFMEYLSEYYPEDCTEEQLDALEQFCFRLFDEADITLS